MQRCSHGTLAKFVPYDNLYSLCMVANNRKYIHYNIQLKQKITFLNLTTAQLNYISNMTIVLNAGYLIEQSIYLAITIICTFFIHDTFWFVIVTILVKLFCFISLHCIISRYHFVLVVK